MNLEKIIKIGASAALIIAGSLSYINDTYKLKHSLTPNNLYSQQGKQDKILEMPSRLDAKREVSVSQTPGSCKGTNSPAEPADTYFTVDFSYEPVQSPIATYYTEGLFDYEEQSPAELSDFFLSRQDLRDKWISTTIKTGGVDFSIKTKLGIERLKDMYIGRYIKTQEDIDYYICPKIYISMDFNLTDRAKIYFTQCMSDSIGDESLSLFKNIDKESKRTSMGVRYLF